MKMRFWRFFCILAVFGSCVAADDQGAIVHGLIDQDSNQKKADVVIEVLLEKLCATQISADAAWEVFASLVDADKAHKLLGFLNLVGEAQKRGAGRRGFRIYQTGLFLRDCSTLFNIDKTGIVNTYTYRSDNDEDDSNILLFDFRKAFFDVSRGDIEILKLPENDSPEMPKDIPVSENTPDTKDPAKKESSGKPLSEKPSLKPNVPAPRAGIHNK